MHGGIGNGIGNDNGGGIDDDVDNGSNNGIDNGIGNDNGNNGDYTITLSFKHSAPVPSSMPKWLIVNIEHFIALTFISDKDKYFGEK